MTVVIVVPKAHEPGLRDKLKDWLGAAIVALLVNLGAGQVPTGTTLPPAPSTCAPEVVRPAAEAMRNAAEEAQGIRMVAKDLAGNSAEIHLGPFIPMAPPPERRRGES